MKFPIPFLPWTGRASLEVEIPDNTEEKFRLKIALEVAVKARANLAGAYLAGANLADAYLAGANLADANLADAYLAGAYLAGAKIRNGLVLVGDRPFLQIGPIGSRCAQLRAYVTEKGVYIEAGCFFDTLNQFAVAVENEHGSNRHGDEYRAAIALIEAHARHWTPAKKAEAA